jgi:hypothetical protein
MERSAIRDGHSAFAIPGFRCAPSGLRMLVSRILDCFAEPVIGRRFADPLVRNDGESARNNYGVMRGLDPRIHRHRNLSKWMDCRVKPGNDAWGNL